MTSFEDYWAAFWKVADEFPEWRAGQVRFNVLASLRPDISEEIRGTVLDPFHFDADHPRVKEFDSWLAQRWWR